LLSLLIVVVVIVLQVVLVLGLLVVLIVLVLLLLADFIGGLNIFHMVFHLSVQAGIQSENFSKLSKCSS
jgi:hypothetical protein